MGSAPTRLSLLVQTKTTGQQDIDKLEKSVNRLTGSVGRLTKANKTYEPTQEKTNKTLATGTKTYLAAAAAVTAYAVVLRRVTIESAKYAARTEALGVVVEQLAKVNNLNVDATNAQVKAIQRLGITTQQSLQVVSRMIFAQLDLRKSTELARLAQNAAFIAQKDSSEALQGLIHGITTRQTEVLRTYGIVVTFEEEFARVRKERGRELNEQEKTQIAFNKVLAQGSKIAGVYEAAMTTVGKRMTSLTRITAELKNTYGQEFNPILTRTILLLERMAGAATDSAGGLATATIGATALTAALAAAKFTPGGPLAKAAVGGAVGLGAYFGIDYLNDPVEATRLLSSQAIGSLRAKQRDTTDKAEFDRLGAAIQQIRLQAVQSLARALQSDYSTFLDQNRAFQSRGPGFDLSDPFRRAPTSPLPSSVNLGGGLPAITGGEIGHAILQLGRTPADTGAPLFNQPRADELRRTQDATALSAKVAADAKQIAQLVSQFAREGASELQQLLLAEAAFISRLQAPAAAQVQRARDLFSTARLGLLPLGGQTPSTQIALAGGIPGIPLGLRGAVGPGAETAQVPSGFIVQPGAVIGAAQRRLRTTQGVVRGTAGPGDEVAAVERVTQLRLKNLQLAQAAGDTFLDIEVQRSEILADREIQLHQLRMNNLEQYRQAVVGAFQALLGGGRSGISSFLQSQGIGLLSSIAGNAATTFGGSLGFIPNSGLLGKLFQGTPFLNAGGGGGGGGGSLANLPLGNQTAATRAVLGIGSTATGAASGVAGLGSSIVGGLSVAAPYLALAAPLIGLVSSLIPDPKAERARERDILIESARVVVAGPSEFHFTSEGGGFDRNFLGEVRSLPASSGTGGGSASVRDAIDSGMFDEDLKNRVFGDG